MARSKDQLEENLPQSMPTRASYLPKGPYTAHSKTLVPKLYLLLGLEPESSDGQYMDHLGLQLKAERWPSLDGYFIGPVFSNSIPYSATGWAFAALSEDFAGHLRCMHKPLLMGANISTVRLVEPGGQQSILVVQVSTNGTVYPTLHNTPRERIPTPETQAYLQVPWTLADVITTLPNIVPHIMAPWTLWDQTRLPPAHGPAELCARTLLNHKSLTGGLLLDVDVPFTKSLHAPPLEHIDWWVPVLTCGFCKKYSKVANSPGQSGRSHRHSQRVQIHYHLQ